MVFPALIIGGAFLQGSPADSALFMNGELSVGHADAEIGCKDCHVPWKGVENKSCYMCHYDAEHVVKKDLRKLNKRIGRKVKCFNCHEEHRGRSHDLMVIKSRLAQMLERSGKDE